MFGYARWKRFDAKTILLLVLAIGLYYFQFYHSKTDEFSLDSQTHIEYLVHIADYGQIPTPEDRIVAARHPPTYYAAAAVLYKLGQVFQVDDPLLLARQFSMVCYIVFLLFSIHLLRLVLPAGSGGYYAALALLLFWPLGVTIGGRITCDPLLFAGEAGVLYCLTRWLKNKEVGSLSAAFLCAALSIGAKNGGVIMLCLSGLVLAFSLFQYRKSPRIFLRWDLIASILFALLVYKLTKEHGWVTEHTAADTGIYNWPLWWKRVSSFSLFLLLYETSLGLSHEMFWNMWLHTLLLGDDTMPWKSVNLLITFQSVWVVLLLYQLLGIFKVPHLLRWEKQVFALMLCFTFTMIAAMLYMLLVTSNFGYGDARYAYPCVAVIALWHGKTMELYRASGPSSLYRVGVGLAAAFAALTCVLFVTQYTGPIL